MTTQANLNRQAVQLLAKLATDQDKNQKDEDVKEKKHKARTKLGPLEHAYVADAAGGQALANTGRKLQQMRQDPDNPYQSAYDRLVTMQGGLAENLGERIQRGASRLADNPAWRLAASIDPTASDTNEGFIGTLAGFGGGEDKAEGAKRRAAEAYAKFIKKYQDKADFSVATSERETPFHVTAQGQLANLDSDIAGHSYMRNERPFHYWLNPLSKSGPFTELTDRAQRRFTAANALPESTAGRLGMSLSQLATLGVLPLFMGGEKAQQKLRASAVKNQLYAPEAMPDEKAASVIALLARAVVKQARCWEGYEPVPGKARYSEDSCRPVGSSKKLKKEKKAGIFYRDLEVPHSYTLSDVSGHGLVAMQTQEPRLLTSLFSNSKTDTRAALDHLKKYNPNSLKLSFRPEEHPSNAVGAALQELFPSRYRTPQEGELATTLVRMLKDEEPPRFRQDVKEMRQRYAPMMHQQYASSLDKEMLNNMFSMLEKTYPNRKANAASDIKEKKAGVPELLDKYPHAVDFAVRPVLGAGLGYGINSLNEMVAPTENEDEKRLKRRLAIIGGAGVGLGGAIGSALQNYLRTRSSAALAKAYPNGKANAASDIAELGKLASGAWTREEGQSESGGLNAKGRASLKAQGHDIKPPVTESNPKGERAGRKASFCARMSGMKSKLTGKETANDPDSRINKALRKWNC